MTTPRIAEVFRRGPGTSSGHGSAYGGHTVACAPRWPTSRSSSGKGLVEHAAGRSGYFAGAVCCALQRKHAIISDVRGIGLLWAVILDGKDAPTMSPAGNAPWEADQRLVLPPGNDPAEQRRHPGDRSLPDYHPGGGRMGDRLIDRAITAAIEEPPL